MNQTIFHKFLASGKVIEIVMGDITEEKVDAIINAANSHLNHGGGVAGAIVRKGGKIIQEESDKIDYVPVGEVAITTAGKLSAKYVIHAVGPIWGEGDEENKLTNAVLNSLKLAEKKKFTSVSFPAVSAGIFGFPKERCAKIMIKNIKKFLNKHSKGILKEVRICLFDETMVNIFRKQIQKNS